MKIIMLAGLDYNGVGAALRGQEMSLGLRWLGHEMLNFGPADIEPADVVRLKPDAVILTGTWHQLQSGAWLNSSGRNHIVWLAEGCEAAGVPCIWWYGSNGSVFGCTDADPAVRLAGEREIIAEIARRKFVAVICPYSMDIYERHGLPREKMRLVPSVFDGDLFTPAQSEYDRHIVARLRVKYNLPTGAFCIGTIGNAPNSKGGDDVLRAVALLKNEMPDLYYLILHTPAQNLSKTKARSPDGKTIGNSEWDVLQDSICLAEQLGVADRVRFIGARFPRVAMPAFYRLLDVYCSPSKAENLGQPLVESQLCGLPLVTYKGFSFDFVASPLAQQIAPSHTITDDYGLVIPECRPEDLARAIRRARSTAGFQRDEIRKWTYERFHHHNAARMIEVIHEYRQAF